MDLIKRYGMGKIRILIILIITSLLGWKLYSDLTHNLSMPPIEIPIKCQAVSYGFDCKREGFNPETYFGIIKNSLDALMENQTIVQHFANITPDLFQYSIKVRDASFVKKWKGQNTHLSRRDRGECDFPSDFTFNENLGSFKQNFGLKQIPSKLRILATSINNCGQNLQFNKDPEIKDIEETERYDISIILAPTSYIMLLILALSLTTVVLKISSVIYKFAKRGLNGL